MKLSIYIFFTFSHSRAKTIKKPNIVALIHPLIKLVLYTRYILCAHTQLPLYKKISARIFLSAVQFYNSNCYNLQKFTSSIKNLLKSPEKVNLQQNLNLNFSQFQTFFFSILIDFQEWVSSIEFTQKLWESPRNQHLLLIWLTV